MPVKVWDLPLRLFHWLLVICVIGALVTIKLGGTWMIWHGRFGLAIIGLLSFRLVWGIAGSTHARFVSFFPTPRRVIRYLRGQWEGLGHNPLGALSVFALIGLFGFQALSGLVATDDIAFSGPLTRVVSSDFSSLMSGWHRRTEELLYLLVGLHVLAIVIYRVRGHNLLGPMIHGYKKAPHPATEQANGGRWPALIIALALAGLAVWAANGSWIPAPAPAPAVPAW
ncbi:cytochrome b/b6 domain-containing protein [Halopseudomonas phragmitis]|uniref:Cytochrome B n=2 Tax=Pseudomonadaceae TaxID=135621 RepID=A0A1V0B1Y7_9GAMM|nr:MULTISPECIES: cytochrome b/b6 domain-containing protein [Pseudomonadaceae]AQZ93953.1 cytochrome B [Halopseudomonas phragmitis]RHW20536.1 cytochrome B [Pseudomonas jilinensis]